MSFDLKITNQDLVITNSDLKTVQDSEKLIQDILKICLTQTGSNPYHPWYGSLISRSIIGSSLDTSMLINIAESQLNSALENLKNLQVTQLRSFQKVSADEQLSSIRVNVERNSIDPRLFTVNIYAMTKGLKPITTAFRISTI